MSKIIAAKKTDEGELFEVILLDQSRLNEAVQLLNHAFCTENPVWKHFVTDQTLTIDYVTDIAKQSLKSKMLYGLVGKKENQIRSIILYLDMVDYIQLGKKFKQKYSHLKLISQLGTYSQILQKQLKSKTYQRGHASWGFMISTSQKFFKAKYGTFLLSIVLIDLRDRGYKVSYGRSTNKISRIGMQKMGGRVINNLRVQGTNLQFNLMENTHENFRFDDSVKRLWQQVGFTPNYDTNQLKPKL